VASIEPIALLGGSSTGKSSDAVTRMATCRQSQVLLNEGVEAEMLAAFDQDQFLGLVRQLIGGFTLL
jgi:hypothetical protein